MSSHGRVTALLCVSWMLVGIGYYGVVFIIPQFLNSKYRLQKGLPPLPDDVEYVVTTATAVSEIVGYLLCGGLADQIGRRSMLTVSFGGSAAFALICGVIAHQRTPGAWKAFMAAACAAKAFLAAAFMLMYTITPEIYPPTVRSTALGACSIFTRMGAAFTPFLAQYLLDSASALATYCTFSATMLVAAVCTALLPYETLGYDADAPDALQTRQRLANVWFGFTLGGRTGEGSSTPATVAITTETTPLVAP